MQKPDDPFYLAMIRFPKLSVWYKKHEIHGYCRKVNHTGRHMALTALRQAGVPALEICQLSGHKNPKTLDSYSAFSVVQQTEEMAEILSKQASSHGPLSAHTDNTKQNLLEKHAIHVKETKGMFCGAIFQHCTFVLGENRAPVEPQVPKRRRYIFELSDEED